MPRDLNQLVERLRRGRDLVLTEDGQVATPEEAAAQEDVVMHPAEPTQQGVMLKPERFGDQSAVTHPHIGA